MRLLLSQNEKIPEKTALALGMFDGVHLGHAGILDAARSAALERGLKSAVFAFSNHPLSAIRPQEAPPLLTTPSEKIRLFAKAKLQYAAVLPFTGQLQRMPAEEYVRFLFENYNARCLVIGENHRFGFGGKGDVQLLRRLSAKLGFEVIALPAVTMHEKPISSTRIRRELLAGDVGLANEMLGRPYSLEGRIIEGQGLGHTLGFPTINLKLPKDKLLPRFGVYSLIASVEGQRHRAICNIGLRPTVGGETPVTEAFLFDFSGDVYGQSARLELVAFMRPEQKFDSLDALTGQVSRDIEAAKQELKALY